MVKRIGRVLNTTDLLWMGACGIGGAVVGGVVGYGNAGWIGAVAIAFCGLILGALLSRLVLAFILNS